MRTVIDLNGLWRFLPDLDPQYHDNADYAQVSWDRRHWDVVRVPGCWNKYAERYALYEGVAWFARTFHLPDWPADGIGVLRFGAVNYEAQVYVNGEKAGEHRGGYTEFTVDASRWLRPGENLIVVRVDDRRHRVLLPACFGWFNYGGIHRDVVLEVTRGARLDWAGIQGVPVAGGAEGRIRLRPRPRALDDRRLRCRAVIRDPGGNVAWEDSFDLAGDGPGEVARPWQLPVAQPWTPASPALHDLELTLASGDGETLDRVRTAFGIRELRAEGHALLLNGEPLWLRGICYLEDHPATGITYDPAVGQHDLDDIQELGANALRCHVPLHEEVLRACDRRGLLVLSEAPIYCLDPREAEGSAFSQPAYRDLARGMLGEMVSAAYNHPSVIAWSLGNECKVAHPEAPAFFSEMAAAVRALDDSRPLMYASLYGEMGPVGDLVDIIGINQYWGWYDRVGSLPGQDRPLLQDQERDEGGSRVLRVAALDLGRLAREIEEKAKRYDKPMIFTEFGADAVPGYRSADLQLWSEDYQAYLLERTLDILLQDPNVCGAFPFLYHDYPDPSKYVNTHWQGDNLKGVVTYDRVRKLGFSALQAAYRSGRS